MKIIKYENNKTIFHSSNDEEKIVKDGIGKLFTITFYYAPLSKIASN